MRWHGHHPPDLKLDRPELLDVERIQIAVNRSLMLAVR
jgi:hypothetical protein